MASAPFDGLGLDEPLPPHYRHNAVAFVTDASLCTVGLSFGSLTTVLPAFLMALTNSEVTVGLAAALLNGVWLLPQLAVGSISAGYVHKKPLAIGAAWVGRSACVLAALFVWGWGNRSLTLTLIGVLLSLGLFYVTDAALNVLWFELWAKAIPSRRRGRLAALFQVLGGLGGVGAGLVVRYVLSPGSPWPFPHNYAVLFGLAAAFFLAGAAALSVLREPHVPLHEERVPPVHEVLATLPRLLAADRPMLRLVSVRVLSGFVGVASAFYVLHATRMLGLARETTGSFVSAQVLGSLAAGLLMGVVQDRWGPLIHLRIALVLAVLPPAMALGLGALAPWLRATVLYPYLFLYFILGISVSALGWPFYNWILEYARPTQRPLYIGMVSTLSAVTMLAPLLGGWLVNAVSYPAVFVASIVFVALTGFVSWPLPSTRGHHGG